MFSKNITRLSNWEAPDVQKLCLHAEMRACAGQGPASKGFARCAQAHAAFAAWEGMESALAKHAALARQARTIGWARPGKPEHQRALFASFSKKEVPRRDQAHKTLRYHMRKLQRRRLSHRLPASMAAYPLRPVHSSQWSRSVAAGAAS